MSKVSVKNDILTIKSKIPIRIGLVSDFHCGHSHGLMGKSFVTEKGQEIRSNKAQEMLYIVWKRLIEQFNKFNVQHIFVVGDVTHGLDPAAEGGYVFVRMPDQKRIGADLLEEMYHGIKSKPDFYIWSGSTYHQGKEGLLRVHQDITIDLNSRRIPAKFMGYYAYIELYGADRMRRLWICHEAPAALVYPATLMSRDIKFTLEAEAEGKILSTDAIIRAHTHSWLHVDHSGKHAVKLGALTGLHPSYIPTRKYFAKYQPDVCGAIMLMDEYGRLQFWGGSYPLGFTKTEKIEFHLQNIKHFKVEPGKRLPVKGINKKDLS